jgi:hypothetical protein
MPVRPLCQVSELLPPRVEDDLLQRGQEVGLVRDVGLVDLLDPSEVDEPRRHPVGEHGHVAADVLALLQLRAEAREPLVVGVDLLEVVDGDAELVLELLERRGRLHRLEDDEC